MTFQQIYLHLITKTKVLFPIIDGLTQERINEIVKELAYAMSISDVSQDCVFQFSLIIDQELRVHIHGPANQETLTILQNYGGVRQSVIQVPSIF